MVQIVTKDNLGADFVIDTAAGKIKVNLDGVTIKRNATTGKLYVPSGSVGGISSDAGNLLTAGSDGKVYIDEEAVQDAIGTAIANGAGITYDDALDAIKVAMGNMTVQDTDSIDLTLDLTTDPDNPVLKGDLRVDGTVTGNLLKVGTGGVAVDPDDVNATVKNDLGASHGINTSGASPVFRLTYYSDKTADAPAEELQDAFGQNLGVYVLK